MIPNPKTQRPVFFKLMQIEMPVGSITSILHRVTGVLLALGLPLSLYLLQLSLQGLQVLAGAQQRMAGQLRRGCLRLAQPVGNVFTTMPSSLRAWLVQPFTAVYMLRFSIFLQY